MDRRLRTLVLDLLVAAFRDGATSVTSAQVQAQVRAAGEDVPTAALDPIFEELLNHRLIRGPGKLTEGSADDAVWVITGVASSVR